MTLTDHPYGAGKHGGRPSPAEWPAPLRAPRLQQSTELQQGRAVPSVPVSQQHSQPCTAGEKALLPPPQHQAAPLPLAVRSLLFLLFPPSNTGTPRTHRRRRGGLHTSQLLEALVPGCRETLHRSPHGPLGPEHQQPPQEQLRMRTTRRGERPDAPDATATPRALPPKWRQWGRAACREQHEGHGHGSPAPAAQTPAASS